MSKFHKTFKNNFTLNEWYNVEKKPLLKVRTQYVKFERGHLQFRSENGASIDVSGGDIRDNLVEITKDDEVFTVNGWVKID